MKRLRLLIIPFLLICFIGNGQQNVKLVAGTVVDQTSGEPIPFASIQIQTTKIGTITNTDGEFELKVSADDKNKTILVSCLGYDSQEITMQETQIISLKSKVFDINEVVVKPLDPLEELRRAIKKIPANYPVEAVVYNSFYRSLFKEDTAYINLVEAVCDFLVAPYSATFDVYAAQKDYFKKKSLVNCTWQDGVNNYFDVYTNPKDQLRLIELRSSDYMTKYFGENFVVGGPLNMLASDKVKYLNDFMDEKHFKHYKYKNEGRTVYMGRDVLVISFKPKGVQLRNRKPGYAKYVNRKKYYNAEFEGKIYIDILSSAFVRIESDVVKVRIGQRMQPLKRHLIVDYKQNNGKWYLSQVTRHRRDSHYSRGVDELIEVEEQLIINGVKDENIAPFDDNSIIPHSNYFSLNRYPTTYNASFWNTYNVLTHNKLSNKVSSDLQQTKTLEKQFEDRQKYNKAMTAPVAKQKVGAGTLHGQALNDTYQWIENKESSEVSYYLNAENKYTDNYYVPLKELQSELREEMLNMLPKRSPEQEFEKEVNGEYTYYKRYFGGDSPAIYRKKNASDAAEELIVDTREMEMEYEEFYISETSISPDNKYYCMSIDTVGNERYSCFIVDVKTKKILPKRIPNFWNMAWASDSRSFYYVRNDSTNRPCAVYRHELGKNGKPDELIYEENDEAFDVRLMSSELGNYIYILADGSKASEYRILNTKAATDSFEIVVPRRENHHYTVKESEDFFYILSNNDGDNKLYQTSKTNIAEENWQLKVEVENRTILKKFWVTKKHLIYQKIGDVKSSIHTFNLGAEKYRDVPLGDEMLTSDFMSSCDYWSDTIQIARRSFNIPTRYYNYSLVADTLRLKKAISYPNYTPDDYKTVKVWAKGADGVQIPISLVYGKGIELDGNNPLLLEAYGSYGSNTFPSIDVDKIALLKRGFIYAIAHVRGSSMMGKQWHEQGRLLSKKNTIDDYISCAQYLIDEQYTNRTKLFGIGGSAGGMLMGAVANKAPHLFCGLVLEYPAVCVVDWLKDRKGVNIDEYGDIRNDLDAFNYVMSYSPYNNITKQDYPAMLFVSGYNDLRVRYWNATKMMARLRTHHTGTRPLLLKTYNWGHVGGSSRFSYYNEMAFEYAFILNLLDGDGLD